VTRQRLPTSVLVLVLLTGISLSAQIPAPAPSLTLEQMETFLLKARIERTRPIGEGVTNARRATLADGAITHDAQIQTVDESRALFEAGKVVEINFKDSYRYNIAGYRVAVLLGLDNVPVSVERDYQGRPAAVTWWIDDVMMDEGTRTKKQVSDPDQQRQQRNIHLMRVFDALIHNTDRNQGNVLWTKDWKMWLIDHTRAFRLARELRNADQLQRVDRALLDSMRGLTAASVGKAVGTSLTRDEIESLIARRDLLVQFFDKRIAERGEAAVIYTRR
jgi:hypothetical protein